MTEQQQLSREIYVGKLAWVKKINTALMITQQLIFFFNIFYSFFNQWITDKELEEVFSEFGKISEIIFAESKINGKSRGFAKIIYEEQGAAFNAYTAMNGKQPFRDNDDTNIIVAFPDLSKRIPNIVNNIYTYTT